MHAARDQAWGCTFQSTITLPKKGIGYLEMTSEFEFNRLNYNYFGSVMGLHQVKCIHVIFSWTQIGRFGFTDREIGSQIGRFFWLQKIFNFSVKYCYLQHRRSL